MYRFAVFAISSLLIFANSLSAQPDSIYRLAAGTRIRLTVEVEVSSKVASVGDTFIATVAKDVAVRDAVVLPVGTVIEGRVESVRSAGSAGRSGSMDVVFETMKLSGTTRRIEGTMTSRLLGESPKTFNLLSILGGLAAGAAIGSASSPSGALIGAGVGAAAGTGVAVARKGKDVSIRKGEEFEIELKKEVVLPVLDY